CRWPALSFQTSVVATLNFATAAPPGVYRNSASRPRLPTRITLLTEPMDDDSTSAPRQLLEQLVAHRLHGAVGKLLDAVVAGRARAVDVLQVPLRERLAVVRLGDRVAARVIADRRIARLDRFVVLAALQVRRADVHLRVVGLIVLRERLDERLEPEDSEV